MHTRVYLYLYHMEHPYIHVPLFLYKNMVLACIPYRYVVLCVFHTLLSLGNNYQKHNQYNGRYINGYLGRTGYTTTFLLCLTLHVSLPLPENHGSLPMMFFYIMCECPINVDVGDGTTKFLVAILIFNQVVMGCIVV